MTDGGRIFVVQNDIYSDIGISTSPTLDERGAAQAAVDAVGQGTVDDVRGSELVVLPIHRPEGVDFRLAWFVRHAVAVPPAEWASYVDARSGEILWRYNRVRFVDFFGTAEGDVDDPSYCSPGQPTPNYPMANMQVTVTGLPSTLTDADGNWTVPFGGNELRQATAIFYGPWFDVNRYTGGDASVTINAQSGVSADFYFDSTNSRRDERDSWYHANRVHDWIKAVDPGFTAIDYRADCWVDRTDGYCPGNAWYDPGDGSINFCRESSSYGNTGQIADVIYHEYGHGITDQVYRSPFSDPGGDLHEGNSDITAVILNDDSLIGRGFFLGNCTTGIRDADNTLQYPEDLTGEGHHDGQIIAGVLWDTYQALIASMGDQLLAQAIAANIWHFSRALGHPYEQPDQVFWTFVADDDNGNVDDGTPHHDEICVGATNHGFECPEILLILITHTPIQSTTEEGDVAVVADVVGTEADVDEVKLFYQLDDGGYVEVPMVNTSGDEYAATIEDLTVPTEVDYYIWASDLIGNVQTAPSGAPANVYVFDVANLIDTIETEEGWQVNLEGTDTATTGAWVRVDPNATSAQPADDHTADPGVLCWVTGNAAEGAPAGENDVDNGRTSLYSPQYNLSGATFAKVKYWYWYSNDKGSSPNSDTWLVQLRNDGGAWRNTQNTTSSTNAWVIHEQDLIGFFIGDLGVVEARFEASDLGSGSLVEAGVDDLILLARFGGPIDVPVGPTASGVPAASYLAGARPNPFNPRTTLRYGLSEAADVRLDIYNVDGRLVTTLVRTAQAAGNYAVVWDGRDGSGREVSSGVYYVRLEAGSFSKEEKLTLLR
jgi:hypothetical protein